MKQPPEYFDDTTARLVYIARTLSSALELEAAFTEAGFDYGVEPDVYRGGFLFAAERVGAFFYVRPEHEEAVREWLASRGLRPVVRERER